MSKFMRVLVVSGCLGLVSVGALMLFGAKPAPKVQLTASFQLQLDDGTEAVFLNDAKGPYITDGRHNVSVWLEPDNGDLFFKFEHHSERSMRIIFPPAGNAECGMLPDTAGVYEGLPDEPVDFFRFNTNNSDIYLGPMLNFLTMPVETPMPVRLWTMICTTQRHYFFMNFSQDVGKITGVVEVIGHCLNNDGKPEQWDLHPVPGTVNMAKVYKHPETGDDSINCLFGEFPMPFKLVLTRR